MPLYPQSDTNQGACPESLLFHCFRLRLTFESIKELGSASPHQYNDLTILTIPSLNFFRTIKVQTYAIPSTLSTTWQKK